ncbi:MAG: hypothetical protein ABEJ43_10250 [Haloferacaceae archaeon]
MDLPEAVRSVVGDESVAARVSLGGEDLLLVTPTRTVVYRGEGLLSDESVTEYGHDVERIAVETKRRKATFRLDYGAGGEQSLTVPASRVDDALHPILAGVLNAAGVTDPGETITRTFRFSELTVVITSARLVKHVGGAVWDDGHEEYRYDDVTDLRFEEGSHGTAVVLRMGDRQERFKTPNDSAREFREELVGALLEHTGHDSLDAFRAAHAEAEPEADDGGGMGVEGLSPLGGDGPGGASGAGAASDASDEDDALPDLDVVGSEDDATARVNSAETADTADVAAELDALREAVERQGERIDAQRELIDQLIDELRRGR